MSQRHSAFPAVVVVFFLVFSPTINQLFIETPWIRFAVQGLAGLFALVFVLRYRLTAHGKFLLGAMVTIAGFALIATTLSSSKCAASDTTACTSAQR